MEISLGDGDAVKKHDLHAQFWDQQLVPYHETTMMKPTISLVALYK